MLALTNMPCVVTSYLNLCTVLFETISALLTTVRVLQGARVAGVWRLHRQGLVYLIFKEGAPHTLSGRMGY